MTHALHRIQQRRDFHASQAALNRRFADESAERGLTEFAAVHQGLAAREQAKANELTMALRSIHQVMQ